MTTVKAAVPVSRKTRLTRGRRRGVTPFFLLPSLAGLAFFILVPFGDVVRRSFTTVLGNGFVGFGNYHTVLTNEAFRQAAFNTARFLATCLPLLLCLSLLLALLIRAAGAKAHQLKTAFLIPMAIPVASVVFLWRALFEGGGIVNGALTKLSADPVRWMDSGAAFWVLAGTFVWKNLGYDILLWLAGLAAIPDSLYEAARVDGAGSLRIFFKITLPGLLPCLYTILVLSLLNAFKIFREAYLVAGDYPHASIYLLQHTFGNWFRELSMEKLTAAAVLVAIAILALILPLRLLWDRET